MIILAAGIASSKTMQKVFYACPWTMLSQQQDELPFIAFQTQNAKIKQAEGPDQPRAGPPVKRATNFDAFACDLAVTHAGFPLNSVLESYQASYVEISQYNTGLDN